MPHSICIPSPAGPLTITASERALTALRFGGTPCDEAELRQAAPLLREAARQLAEYFAGTRRGFTLPLAPAGTAFQQSVWTALESIPYGQTSTYAQIAARIGRPKACRAVGMANNRNPLPILIPCHRVVGASGALVGYAAGVEIKQLLLSLEAGDESRTERADALF